MPRDVTESWTAFFSKKGKAFAKEWNARTKHVCKPCWELHYCPYGKLVEEFPVPIERSNAIQIRDSVQENFAKGKYIGDQKKFMKRLLADLNPNQFLSVFA